MKIRVLSEHDPILLAYIVENRIIFSAEVNSPY